MQVNMNQNMKVLCAIDSKTIDSSATPALKSAGTTTLDRGPFFVSGG